MIRLTDNKYKIGIDASIDFINRAKSKGITLLYSAEYFFLQNYDMWCNWFKSVGVTNIKKVTSDEDIHEDDLCIIIAHLIDSCKSKYYIAINTESLVTRQICYNSMYNAYVIWDYSVANVDYLLDMKIKNAIPLPILWYNNTQFYKNVSFIYDFNREIDIIMPCNSERRSNLLDKFITAGLTCMCVWREHLPNVINKCKVFLNLHSYDGPSALEMQRIFEVRNLPIVVVSEESKDYEYQNQLNKIPFVKYDELFNICVKICTNNNLWNKYLIEQMEMWKKFPDYNIDSALQTILFSKN